MSELLEKINKPNDIKNIDKKDYPKLAEEIRKFLIDSVSKTGGHLASNLGTVDLTIALHAVLDFPKDKIVWDVGHQAYTHKILTGRKDEFESLRQLNGLSGFPKRHESLCDSFDTGHSSTSISATLGMATAAKLNETDEKIVAVIGDGALSGGMALEAINNVADLKRNMLIIINDNKMSISKNVGGMSNYLNKLRASEQYNDFKSDVETSLSRIPKFGSSLVKSVKRTKDHIKNLFISQGLFEDLGITSIGPVDGHNIPEMIDIFKEALKINRPIIICVRTKKGKGYEPAENNPSKYHGVNPFDISTGLETVTNGMMSYTDVFSKTLVKMAKTNDRILAITAAMPDGTGLSRFQKEFPDRFFDVGIAEEHAVTFAAGLAVSGYKPVVSIYSSFYQRAYDQILHDVCIQKLPVTLIFDRAGLVGSDGETHQGIFDMSFLSAMPNMTIIAPSGIKELKEAMKFAEHFDGPIAIRFARGVAFPEIKEDINLQYGKGQILKEGSKDGNNAGGNVAIIAVGSMVEETYKAIDMLEKENVHPAFVNPVFIKPMDTELIKRVAENHKHIIVVEEGIKKGGFGESVETFILESGIDADVQVMAIDDRFVEQGNVALLREEIGISYKNIYEKVMELTR